MIGELIEKDIQKQSSQDIVPTISNSNKRFDFVEEFQVQEKKKRGNPAWVKGMEPAYNPAGKPRRESLKEYARKFLANLDDDSKARYLKAIGPEIVWKMAEGNPENARELLGEGNVLVNPVINFVIHNGSTRLTNSFEELPKGEENQPE